MTRPSGKLLRHEPCPCGTSSDGLAIYDKGNDKIDAYCFVCSKYVKLGESNDDDRTMASSNSNTSNIPISDDIIMTPSLPFRGISVDTLKYYGAHVTYDETNGEVKEYHYPVTKDGTVCGNHIRILPKDFSFNGDAKSLEFFGQTLCGTGGRLLVITEGYEDAMSAYQMFLSHGKKIRVVSLPNGANIRSVKTNLEWIESFESICLCLDQDEIGKKLSEEISNLLTPGKVKVMALPVKDANDMLMKGLSKEFYHAYLNATEFKPDGIVGIDDIFEAATAPPVIGKDWPWKTLTKLTYGRRRKELYGFGAGCVDADTEFLSPTGWIRIADYSGGNVLAYNAESNQGIFVKPSAYIKEPCEYMWHIKTKYGVDQVLSDEHNILYDTDKTSCHVKTLKEIREIHDRQVTGFRGKIRTTFLTPDITLEFPLTDAEIRLQVAINADGSYPKKAKKNRCYINIKRKNKQNRLRILLKDAEIPYTILNNSTGNGYETFSFFAPIEKGFNKLWYTCSNDQLKIINDEVLHWDGSIKFNSFYSRSKDDIDFIQYVFSTQGYRASLYIQVRDKGIDYTVHRIKQNHISFRKTLTSSPEFKKYKTIDNFKYCFSVSTSFLVLRRNGNIFITGNSGTGKTEVFKEIIQHIVKVDNLPTGVIFLEEEPAQTAKVIAGKFVNKRFHVPDGSWTQEELVEGIESLRDKIFFYDHYGQRNYEDLKNKIRYMVITLGIKDIFLDHLTALVATEENVNGALERIMADMGGLVHELDFTLYYISHLSTPMGTPHEEGGRVKGSQFRGSRTIMYWSNFLFGLERNQQAEDEGERNTTTFRVLKDRYTGEGTGHTFPLVYNNTIGRLQEPNEEDMF